MNDATHPRVADEGLSTVMSQMRGFVPSGMRITVEQLAYFMGVSPNTINNWNRTYQLPVRNPGQADWIDTDEWWDSLPRKTYDDEKPAKKAGKKS